MNMEFFLSLYDEPNGVMSSVYNKKTTEASPSVKVDTLAGANSNGQPCSIPVVAAASPFFMSTSQEQRLPLYDDDPEMKPAHIAQMIEQTCERLERIANRYHMEALALFLAMTREESRLVKNALSE
jgi:hypothetical protein